MNKFSKIAAVIGAASLLGGAWSCAIEEMPAVNEEITVTVNVETEPAGVRSYDEDGILTEVSLGDTKTYIDNKTVYWGEGEKMKMFLYSADAKYVSSNSSATSEFAGQTSASFSFSITPSGVAPYTLVALYPADAAAKSNNSNPIRCKVILPRIQNATPASYDPSAFIMVTRPETFSELPGQWTAYYRRAVALNKITLKEIDKDIDSVVIAFPEGKSVTGRRYMNLVHGVDSAIYYAVTADVRVQYASPLTGGADMDVWFTTWGVDVAAGEQMTVKAYAADGSLYERTVTAPEKGFSFKEGYLNTMSVRMESASGEGDGGSGEGGGDNPGGEDSSDEGVAGVGNPGWLELPAYMGTEDYILTFYDDADARNYTYFYDKSWFTSMWTAYPLYASTLGGDRYDKGWFNNPDIDDVDEINCWSASYNVCLGETTFVDNADGTGNEYYARGHQIPDADRRGNLSMQKQTYYATNSTPQIHKKFNAGIWVNLEEGVRDAVSGTDTVYVVTGASFNKVGENKSVTWITPKGDPDRQCPVPNYYWKVLLKVKWSGGKPVSASAVGFWFEHREYSGEGYTDHVTSVDQIETYTGFNFFPNLPVALQTTAEASIDWTSFQSF